MSHLPRLESFVARLHVLAGVGHLCNDEAPDEVTRVVRAHLTR